MQPKYFLKGFYSKTVQIYHDDVLEICIVLPFVHLTHTLVGDGNDGIGGNDGHSVMPFSALSLSKSSHQSPPAHV